MKNEAPLLINLSEGLGSSLRNFSRMEKRDKKTIGCTRGTSSKLWKGEKKGPKFREMEERVLVCCHRKLIENIENWTPRIEQSYHIMQILGPEELLGSRLERRWRGHCKSKKGTDQPAHHSRPPSLSCNRSYDPRQNKDKNVNGKAFRGCLKQYFCEFELEKKFEKCGNLKVNSRQMQLR